MQQFSKGYHLEEMAVIPVSGLDRPVINEDRFRFLVDEEYDGEPPLVLKVENNYFPTWGKRDVPKGSLEIPGNPVGNNNDVEFHKEVLLLKKERRDALDKVFCW